MIARRNLLRIGLSAPLLLRAGRASGLPSALLDAAKVHPQLRAIAIWQGGKEVAARGYRSFTPDDPANIKSASKSLISAMAGIAIAKGILTGSDQTVASVLTDKLPENPDPRLLQVTLGDLLSMQSGMKPTEGAAYGEWAKSADWTRAALALPMVGVPGEGGMLYSTASTHLVGAMIATAARRSLLQLTRAWFGHVGNFAITEWVQDPQGFYMGGNQLWMSTRSLMAFGAIYAAEGHAGRAEVVPYGWIRESWKRRTTSPGSGAGYGYGWFLSEMNGRPVNFGWGYGGQMIYVAPGFRGAPPTAIAMTSDPELPSGSNGYREKLHGLAAELLRVI